VLALIVKVAVAVQGGTATFTISASTGYLGDTTGAAGPPILYQWQSAPAGSGTFTNIPNATEASYTTPPLAQSQNGAQFRVSMTTAGLALTSSIATVTMVSDTAPPQPVQIISVNNALTVVTVAFSKPLDNVSAQRAQNYVFSPGNIAVTSASLDASGTNVILTAASALPQNTLITLAITGVKDLAGVSVPTNTTITFSCALSGPAALAPTILSDGPLAYWRLSEAGGGTAIDSVGGHNGTYASAAIPGVPGPRPPAFLGLEGTNIAAQFQAGIDQSWVTVPALNLNTNTVTFVAWVYPIGNQQGYAGLLMTRTGSTQGGWGYTTSDQIGYTWNGNSSATYNFQSGLVPPQNQWSFIALVIDPTKAVLYLYNTNGLLSATNAIAHQNEVWNGTAQIGNDAAGGGGSRTFNGVMDEVAVFNKAVSPARIAAYYQAGLTGGVIVTNGAVSPALLEFTSINVVSGQAVLQWIGNGMLEEATNVTGPWTPSSSQNNPQIRPASGTRFYRLHQ
jgi:hypothetical protein